jgi:hypothetical protein
MLHLEHYYSAERPTIEDDHRAVLRRFDNWAACACGCGRRWNFANQIGLATDVDLGTHVCKVRKWQKAFVTGRGVAAEIQEVFQQTKKAWWETKGHRWAGGGNRES